MTVLFHPVWAGGFHLDADAQQEAIATYSFAQGDCFWPWQEKKTE